MMNNCQIVWEKWRDPFLGYDENEIDIENTHTTNFLNEIIDDGEEDEEFEDPQQINPIEKPVRIIYTPMGIIPYNEYTASSKIFNFWVGHTPFSITKRIAYIIENTDGVETLDIFTRYRFRIAIGKVFKETDVMQDINKNVISFLGE